ncbi:uncharacterized protein [Rutidosis leptorrhynchoides]|uniref:uncharacterized protein n=1 Tax=Rutidosis leptorrhynchoides TaxID=125765 RepID=UPI003A99D98A
MGIIKDGTISGTIPSTEPAFAVHYPGYPSSISRAIQTLGGDEAIVKGVLAMSDNKPLVREFPVAQSKKLELRFRPEDPYSHPAFGEHHPCTGLLLKISKVKSCAGKIPEASVSRQSQIESGSVSNTQGVDKADNMQTPHDQINLCADIVARVSENYRFDGMADYQHAVAVHADVARRKKRSWSEAEEPFSDCNLPDVDQDDVMLLLPPLLSLKDVPENLVLRPSVPVSSKKNNERVVENRNEVEIEPEPALQIDFGAKDILVSSLFYRPYCFTVTLLGCAFHSNIQFYQQIQNIRVPRKVNWMESIAPGTEQWDQQMAISELFDERPIWPKDSVIDCLLGIGLKFSPHMLKRLLLGVAYNFSNGPFLRFWIRKGYDQRVDPESRILNHRWKDLCAFRVFPYKFQTSFQLFEMCKTGWFSEWVLESIRSRVTMRFLSVYPGLGAEKYLKAASDDFQKAKKMCHKESLKIDHIEHDDINKSDGDTEKPANIDDDDEEDEEEEEYGNEVDDESDPYESVDQGEEHDEISLQSQSLLDPEDNSQTYLQQLFGAFPSGCEGGNSSEEEYQIYEPESDGNNSDEE